MKFGDLEIDIGIAKIQHFTHNSRACMTCEFAAKLKFPPYVSPPLCTPCEKKTMEYSL